MKAVKILSPGQAAVVEVPIPKLRPDYVLVKTKAVALNPTDWKHVDRLATPHATVGCDYSGVIEAVGDAVPADLGLKKGDRVAGFVHGANAVELEDGAFGEWLVAKTGLVMKIPDDMSFEDASAFGVGIVTVGQGMYQSMGLPWPEVGKETVEKNGPILIYGGSTATGAYAIQFAKLSGFDVTTTCSPRNFPMAKALGASAVFDYASPTCGADIRAHTRNELYYAFDTVSEAASPQICADALASHPAPSGKRPFYGVILPALSPRDNVERGHTLGYSAVGEYFILGSTVWEARPQDLEFAIRFFKLAEGLLAEKRFKVHRPEVREGGLEGVLGGMDDLRQGRVSGKKVVYRVNES